MPRSTATTVAATLLALSSLATCDIQITQPAVKATTLALQPNPVLHWVYTTSDPQLIGIVVRQASNDNNYAPSLILARAGTPISMSSIAIPLNTVKFEEGMNVTIAITDLTEENQDDPLAQRVLASTGPLRLVTGSNDVEPEGTASDISASPTTAVETTSSDSSSPSTTSSNTNLSTATAALTASFTTDDASSNESSTKSDVSPTKDTSLPTSDENAAATSSSEAEKLSTVTVLYVITLIVTAIPAFLFGYNP